VVKLLDVKTPTKAEVRQLRALEPIFHRSPGTSDRVVFEAMTTPDYWEIGASGTIYRRDEVLDTVANRYATGDIDPAGPMVVDDFAVAELAPNAFLVTYLLVQPSRRSRRATFWIREGGAWKAAYHQGTLANGFAAK